MENEQDILNRLTKLEQKALQVNLQPTERENLKNNLFEGFGTATATDTKTYFKVMWKNKPYFIPTGLYMAGYVGYVNSDGTAGSLPTGWTSSNEGSSTYKITHNLGTANYSCVAISYGSNAYPSFNWVGTNDVQIRWLVASGGGTLTDTKFYFILIPF